MDVRPQARRVDRRSLTAVARQRPRFRSSTSRQWSCTTSMPARANRSAASSFLMPSWNQTAFGRLARMSSTCGGISRTAGRRRPGRPRPGWPTRSGRPSLPACRSRRDSRPAPGSPAFQHAWRTRGRTRPPRPGRRRSSFRAPRSPASGRAGPRSPPGSPAGATASPQLPSHNSNSRARLVLGSVWEYSTIASLWRSDSHASSRTWRRASGFGVCL